MFGFQVRQYGEHWPHIPAEIQGRVASTTKVTIPTPVPGRRIKSRGRRPGGFRTSCDVYAPWPGAGEEDVEEYEAVQNGEGPAVVVEERVAREVCQRTHRR